MKEKSKGLYQEVKNLVIYMAFLNSAIFILSLFWGFNIYLFLGLIAGLLFSCFNMIYLGYSINKSIEKSPEKAKRYLFINYILRYFVFCILFAISAKINLMCAIGLTIPLFYPKIIYLIKFFRKEGG